MTQHKTENESRTSLVIHLEDGRKTQSSNPYRKPTTMAAAKDQFIMFSILLFIPSFIGLLLLLTGTTLCLRDDGEQYAVGMGLGFGVGMCVALGTEIYRLMYRMHEVPDRKKAADTQASHASQATSEACKSTLDCPATLMS